VRLFTTGEQFLAPEKVVRDPNLVDFYIPCLLKGCILNGATETGGSLYIGRRAVHKVFKCQDTATVHELR
jgi:hypothetical protein